MPELRYNIATGDWVVFATERAKRPHDFIKAKKEAKVLPEYQDNCPFCPGNESKTPGEIFRLGGAKSWKVRCVPNLFGALSPQQTSQRRINGIYISMGGFGNHEVIVENPRHNTCIALMSDAEVGDIIRAYKSRYVSLRGTPGVEAIIIFKNHGPGAGTSLEHPHSQLIATPIVPPQTRVFMERAADFYEKNGECLYCKIVEEESRVKTRVVLETDHFISFLPYAGVLPFVIWICPKEHVPSFAGITEGQIDDLAHNLKVTLQKFYYGLDNPDFNYTIRSYAAKEGGEEYLHWFLNIIPRMSLPAGFELGSAMFINASLPEESAEFLRQVKCPGSE
jgi:UDPglucose--hexose-1-phosphate uridylyltransferase